MPIDINKGALTSGLQVVATLFAVGGAFLGDFLPEQIDNKKFIYGIAQLLCLIIFFLIKNRLRSNNTKIEKKRWGTVGLIMGIAFLSCSYLYYNHAQHHLKSMRGVTEKIITGKLTKEAKAMCETPEFTQTNILHKPCEDALLNFRTVQDVEFIWEPGSVDRNADFFVLLYILIILTLSAAIFSLIELNPIGTDTTPQPQGPDPDGPRSPLPDGP
jgi:hypothetical protein